MKTRRQIVSLLPWSLRRPLIATLGTNPWKDSNDTTRVVFIHIPRTGGTSLASALLGQTFGHPYLDEFYAFDPIKAHSYFKTAIVRNPYDRLVSAYHQMQKNDINPTIKKIWNELAIKSFDELIGCLSRPRSCERLTRIVHFRTQCELISCPIGKLDHIGRYEFFQDSVVKLSQVTNRALSVGRLNSSSRRINLSQYYDESACAVVQKVYSKDFRELNYPYELPS